MMGRITTSDGIPRVVEFGRAFFVIGQLAWLVKGAGFWVVLNKVGIRRTASFHAIECIPSYQNVQSLRAIV